MADETVTITLGEWARNLAKRVEQMMWQRYDLSMACDILTRDLRLLANGADTLDGQRAELRGAMAAQDERERLAGERCGIPYHEHGCDWPDRMADEVLGLRVECEKLCAENAKLDRDLAWERDVEHASLRDARDNALAAAQELAQSIVDNEDFVRLMEAEAPYHSDPGRSLEPEEVAHAKAVCSSAIASPVARAIIAGQEPPALTAAEVVWRAIDALKHGSDDETLAACEALEAWLANQDAAGRYQEAP